MRWHWLDNTIPETPVRAHFRCRVLLPSGPLHLAIGATGPYRFLVDGRCQRRGPWRGDEAHLPIDEATLELEDGSHELALELLWFADRAPMAQVATRPGFCLRLRTETGEEIPLVWRAAADPSFGTNACDDRLWWRHMMGGAGLGERIDLREYDADWTTVPCDWPAAAELPLPGEPWFHGMPPLTRIQLGTVTPPEHDWPQVFPPAHHASVRILDLGRLTTGRPRLHLRGGDGRRLRIAYAERLETLAGERQRPERPRANGLEAPRFAPYDELLAPSGEHVWEPSHRRCFRYLVLDIDPGETAVEIIDCTISEERFPAELRARFSCDRPEWERIFATCWRTAALCGHEHLCDGPAYEDAQYAADLVIGGECFGMLGGDHRLMEQACRQFAWTAGEEGLGSTRHPGQPPQRLINFQWFWIVGLERICRWQPGAALCRELAPAVMRVVEAEARRLRGGLLRGGGDQSFIDWAWGHCLQGFRHPRDEEQTSLIANMQSLYGLAHAERVCRRAGADAEAERCRVLGAELRAGLLRQAWLPEEGLYADAAGHPGRSEHAQVWAVLTGLADQPEALMRRMLAAEGLAPCSIHHDDYCFRAAELTLGTPAVAERLQRFERLLEEGFTTFPEEDGSMGWLRSECHGWSSWPARIMIEQVAGIRVRDPQTVELYPGNWPELDRAEAALPWGDEEIRLTWHRADGQLHVDGYIPPELSAVCHLPDDSSQPVTGDFSLVGLNT